VRGRWKCGSDICRSGKCGTIWQGLENAVVEFAALNDYGKPLRNLKSTQRRYTTQYGDRLHCSAFDDENVNAAEQFIVAQREVELSLTCDVAT